MTALASYPADGVAPNTNTKGAVKFGHSAQTVVTAFPILDT